MIKSWYHIDTEKIIDSIRCPGVEWREMWGGHCQRNGDICLAGNYDKICCPEDSCDIDDKVRPNPLKLMKHNYTHPHPNPEHIMKVYRGHILGSKRKYGSARGLIHLKSLIATYLAAKELVIRNKI